MTGNVHPIRPTTPPLTSFQVQANEVAYRAQDGVQHAFQSFDQACKTAITLCQEGRYGRAEYTITRACLRVARAIKDYPSVDILDDLILHEFTPREDHPA